MTFVRPGLLLSTAIDFNSGMDKIKRYPVKWDEITGGLGMGE